MDFYGRQESIPNNQPISQSNSTSPGDRYSSATFAEAPSSNTSEYTEDETPEMAGLQPEKSAVMMHDNTHELPTSVAHSLLYELPREIRDRIYSLCLTSRGGAPIEWPRPWDARIQSHIQPQLLRVCKIVHDETAPLLYTLNNLTFHHPSDANIFVHSFASTYGRHISNLSLHIKAQDMRLWMPYLTSTDDYRSLTADFPNLKALWVRFRSIKWQHQHTPEANLKSWSDDPKLEEILAGLRRVFLPITPPELRAQITEREFQSYMARNPIALQEEGDNVAFHRRLLELRKAKPNPPVAPRGDAPIIRVCCACRIHSTHFATLTTPSTSTRSTTTTSTARQIAPDQAAHPVREGDPFRGFTAADLQTGVKRLADPDLGSANVARTPYANRHGILLALEVHCLDPRKDGADRAP